MRNKHMYEVNFFKEQEQEPFMWTTIGWTTIKEANEQCLKCCNHLEEIHGEHIQFTLKQVL